MFAHSADETTTTFQFHYGTIKSKQIEQQWKMWNAFQFHYGTIKRLVTLLPVMFRHYFNSTMVRLKGIKRIWILPSCRNFNSTMVRLKVIRNNNITLRYRQFQFHYGTIKSGFSATHVSSLKYFNSTMVRLKVLQQDETLRHIFGFQFHYGTIKRSQCATCKHFHAEFQFHYGTIKRESAENRTERFYISIPLWYD